MPDLRVLILEDRENDAELLVLELERLEYNVTSERVETGEAMLEALKRCEWDLIISDFQMPQFSAPEALALCHQIGIDIPFIIVSGTIGEEEAVESMKAGAYDFVIKGRLARLGPAIVRGLRESRERRTLRATEERLRQAYKMEAIGQLAGGVAHDFNNLLGVILGYGELLLRDIQPDARARARADQILRAAHRGAALTRQLLAFSRQQPLEARPIDLTVIASDVEKMIRRLIPENIEIRTNLAAGLARVSADPTQIEQVLMNLVVNARDSMTGGGRLVIETKNVDLDEHYARSHPGVRPGPHVMLAVSDTGHGMDGPTLSHIFEPFFTTKEPGKGTGLGLATAYGIVRQSGGQIDVYSEPGRGSTFKMYLPATEAREAVAAPPPATDLPRVGTETILLVEDDEPLRDVIHAGLEGGGYTVIIGATPEAALAAADGHPDPIHLLLTDVVMPGLSGPEVWRRLAVRRPSARVIFMSGYTGTAAGYFEALDPGQGFLQKPFGLEALLRKVREVLDSPLPP